MDISPKQGTFIKEDRIHDGLEAPDLAYRAQFNLFLTSDAAVNYINAITDIKKAFACIQHLSCKCTALFLTINDPLDSKPLATTNPDLLAEVSCEQINGWFVISNDITKNYPNYLKFASF